MSDAVGLGSAEAARRAALISQVRTELYFDLGLLRSSEVFEVEQALEFDATEAARTFLDFSGVEVLAAEVNGEQVDLTLTDDRLDVEVSAGRNRVRIRSRAAYGTNKVGLYRSEEDGRAFVNTHFQPTCARLAFPCFDQPAIKSRYKVSVRVPGGTVVHSSGRLADLTPTGTAQTFAFETTPPIPTYALAVVAGDWHPTMLPGVPVESHALTRSPIGPDLARALAGELTYVIRFFEHKWSTPFPYRLLSLCFVPNQVSALENVGCITLSESDLSKLQSSPADVRQFRTTLYHEVAHMWFGNDVTLSWWDDLWLNEAFATWASGEAQKNILGYGATERILSNAMAFRKERLPSNHPIVVEVASDSSALNNFDSITYNKAAAAVSELSALVGPQEFDGAVGDYLRNHSGGVATRELFVGHIEEFLGVDLALWSDCWFHGTGVPRYEYSRTPDGRVLISRTDASGAPQRLRVSTFGTPNESSRLREHGSREVALNPGEKIVLPDEVEIALPAGSDYANHKFDQVTIDRLMSPEEIEWAGPSSAIPAYAMLYEMVIDGALAAAPVMIVLLRLAETKADPDLRGACARWIRELRMTWTPPGVIDDHLAQRVVRMAGTSGADAFADVLRCLVVERSVRNVLPEGAEGLDDTSRLSLLEMLAANRQEDDVRLGEDLDVPRHVQTRIDWLRRTDGLAAIRRAWCDPTTSVSDLQGVLTVIMHPARADEVETASLAFCDDLPQIAQAHGWQLARGALFGLMPSLACTQRVRDALRSLASDKEMGEIAPLLEDAIVLAELRAHALERSA